MKKKAKKKEDYSWISPENEVLAKKENSIILKNSPSKLIRSKYIP